MLIAGEISRSFPETIFGGSLPQGSPFMPNGFRLDKESPLSYAKHVKVATWMENYQVLQEFKEIHGHLQIPNDWRNQKLLHWTWIQCQRRRENIIKDR